METQNNKKKRRNDLIFITGLLVIVAMAGACFYFLRGEGNTVTVQIDREVFGVYSLLENQVVEIPSENGGHNRLIIQDGKAYMEYASCPDHLCVEQGAIHRDGESIACLPNKVIVTVSAEEQTESSPDVII